MTQQANDRLDLLILFKFFVESSIECFHILRVNDSRQFVDPNVRLVPACHLDPWFIYKIYRFIRPHGPNKAAACIYQSSIMSLADGKASSNRKLLSFPKIKL